MTNVPPHWKLVALGDLGDEVKGSVLPEPGIIYEHYSVPAYANGAPTLEDGSEIKSGKRPVEPGDLLVSKINPRINRVWMVGEDRGNPQIASTEYFVLRVPDEAGGPLRRWLTWYLRSPDFRAWIKLNVEGATGSHTRAKSPAILAQEVPVAPLDEQRRIVEAIETHLSHLDAGVESLQRAKRNLERMRAAVIRAAVQPAEGVKERAIDDVCEVVSGQTPKGLEAVEGGTIPFYKVGDMNLSQGRTMGESRMLLDEESVARYRLHIRPPGTVIFPKRGGAISTNKKRVLSVPAAFDLNTMGVIPGDEVDSTYLWLWLQDLDLETLSDGSNVPQINHGDIKPLRIPLPPLRVQRERVSVVEAQLSVLDSMDDAVERAGLRSAVLRSATLGYAFSGRLAAPGELEA